MEKKSSNILFWLLIMLLFFIILALGYGCGFGIKYYKNKQSGSQLYEFLDDDGTDEARANVDAGAAAAAGQKEDDKELLAAQARSNAAVSQELADETPPNKSTEMDTTSVTETETTSGNEMGTTSVTETETTSGTTSDTSSHLDILDMLNRLGEGKAFTATEQTAVDEQAAKEQTSYDKTQAAAQSAIAAMKALEDRMSSKGFGVLSKFSKKERSKIYNLYNESNQENALRKMINSQLEHQARQKQETSRIG